jgi:hypothetical protein
VNYGSCGVLKPDGMYRFPPGYQNGAIGHIRWAERRHSQFENALAMQKIVRYARSSPLSGEDGYEVCHNSAAVRCS